MIANKIDEGRNVISNTLCHTFLYCSGEAARLMKNMLTVESNGRIRVYIKMNKGKDI